MKRWHPGNGVLFLIKITFTIYYAKVCIHSVNKA
nr:MAG TPA: hypothetical protein [Caudoviricetes sp.]